MKMAASGSTWDFWITVLNRARFIVAPMVDQSELAWRMFSRQLGAQLCYTPMLHASLFVHDPRYRKEHLATCPEDRPLLVQFCANDPDTFLAASKLVEPLCDGIDLNLGCPQSIARRGYYGAFLQDEWDLVYSIVNKACKGVSVPITCKIRVFEDIDKTVRYAKMLESAGCQILTVHGRRREQKGANTGLASWAHIKAVKEAVKIPVFANGNVQFLRDVHRCLEETGVEGVMSAEGNLYNPAIFTGKQPFCWDMADDYLHMVDRYPAPLSAVRGHLFKIWHKVLQRPENFHLREAIAVAKSLEALQKASETLKSDLLERLSPDDIHQDYTVEDIPYWRCQPYVRPPQGAKEKNSHPAVEGVEKKKRKHKISAEEKAAKRRKWGPCDICKANQKGLKCEHNLCRICCRLQAKREQKDCSGEYFSYSLVLSEVIDGCHGDNVQLIMTGMNPNMLWSRPLPFSNNTIRELQTATPCVLRMCATL